MASLYPPRIDLSISFSHFYHIYKLSLSKPCIFHKFTERDSETQPLRLRLSLWESWREAPERASQPRQIRRAAIGRPFVRAIRSPRLRFLVSVLALSVTFGDTARVAAPSVCFAVACILLAAAPTAPPCFRRWRRSSPLLPRGRGFRTPQSFPHFLHAKRTPPVPGQRPLHTVFICDTSSPR